MLISATPQNESIEHDLKPFLELGIPAPQAEKALRYLRSDGTANGKLAVRTKRLALLANACGCLQNAKLAYSLAARSGIEPDDVGVCLLSASLAYCDCVPAAVRLWKAACEAGIKDESLLGTAARLGGDGAETVKLLENLAEHKERAKLAGTLARQLVAPGWSTEGSWGCYPDPERRLIWWDYTRPSERAPFGMSLTSAPLSLKDKVGSRFIFDARWEILGVTDRCYLEISRDGGKKWDKVTRYEATCDWSEQSICLADYDGAQIVIRFHVLSGGQREGRGFEMANPRIESVPVTRRISFSFPELSAGWQRRSGENRGENLSGHQSESVLRSAVMTLPALESPTLTMEVKLQASSVYAKATVEVLGPQGVELSQELPTTSEWKPLRLALSDPKEISVALSARFTPRKDEDGLWVRNLLVQGGDPGVRVSVPIDGGAEDGEKERLELLAILADGDPSRLARLVALRDGLSSLRDALGLLPLTTSAEQIPILLELYSQLKEEALPAFRQLLELAQGEDLTLQTKVLLTSGPQRYASTRDHLGDGLVSAEEFAANCELYLKMRQQWSEESARAGLRLLMTPIGDETLAERAATFRRLLVEHPAVESFFAAWDGYWEH